MTLFILNYGFAWLCVFISILLGLKYISRKYSKSSSLIKIFNKTLGKIHIPLGILLIALGFIHGLYSSEPVFSINIGTICWVLSILLALNYFLRNLINNHKGWIKYHRILTILFLLSIIIHVINVGGIYIFDEFKNTNNKTKQPTYEIVEDNNKDETTEIKETKPEKNTIQNTSPVATNTETYNKALNNVVLKDGTYTGVADGFGPGLTVSVTILNNKITDIQIVEHHERQARFYAEPIETIPPKIIESQSLDVDVVSGATYTSVGILNAVLDALSKALESGTLPDIIQLR